MKSDFRKRIREKHEVCDNVIDIQFPTRALTTKSHRRSNPDTSLEHQQAFFSILSLLKQWRLRSKERRELADIYRTMPDEALADLGLTREEAEVESGKRFWRA